MTQRSTRRRTLALAALPLALAAALTGCSGGGDTLAQQWADGSDKGFIAGDGTTTSITPEARTQPVEFTGEGEQGETIVSADYVGTVTVVNFWYAGCAPCRAEAPDLAEIDAEYADDEVRFLGVNTRDQAAQALQFAKEFEIEYPSIMDSVGDRAVQRAFAGQIPLNAVPTTLVLDREGRVAHRVVGQIASASQLRTLVKETLAEDAA
ncbi:MULTISPECIES: TlpA disulfide reductase family protein [unclassified Leucobacter]|uniref:TlpA family protein disulfide reductase n=1 Tax=unclassified Leucobacter TaxID=2621730 RepID=UPI00165EA626|nr:MULTISPECIES: TlpA disulfide reductase family protein [unclassified Leucobacter]MBC9927450.1 TlpA family protein disulfide reductase [Leucobacter sp. cx-169]